MGISYKNLAMVFLVGLLVIFAISIGRLDNEVASLKAKVDMGASISQVPNHPNIFYFTSDEPVKGKGVWFVVSPKGIPAAEGSYSNFAGFEVWRLDASNPDNFANLEWLEITSGSPCFGTDDFVIGTQRFGNGKCRDLAFGTMRTDTDKSQIAFRIVSTIMRIFTPCLKRT